MTDNVYDLKAERFISHQTPAAQKNRTSDKKLSSTWISVRGVFKVNILERKSEVLTQQQKDVLKIDCLKCANMWSLWYGAVKKAGHFLGQAAKRQGFSTTQPKTIHASH